MKIKSHDFYQYSTFSALMAGDLYGSISFGELLNYGDFGLGTFHACDGELIVLNGEAYQMLSSGKVNQVSEIMTSPYATLTNFVVDKRLNFSRISFSELKDKLESVFPSLNIFYAIKVKGTFESISLRTITKQAQPFTSLKEAAQDQEKFNLKDISGWLAMIWAPKFANTICVEGFHAHFINDEKNIGGHVFDFQAKNLMLEICYLTKMNLNLPTVESYLKYELDDHNLQVDIRTVE